MPARDPTPAELHDWNERLMALITEMEGSPGTPEGLAYLCQRMRVTLQTAHFFLLEALAQAGTAP